jgi:hypothetical protein
MGLMAQRERLVLTGLMAQREHRVPMVLTVGSAGT